MDEVFGKGHHTVRYSSRNWSGTGSDMSIDESVMREAKTSGGLGMELYAMKILLDHGFSL